MAGSASYGIALGNSAIVKSDDGRFLANRIAKNRYDANNRAAKQKELAKLEDFNVDYNQWLPMYGNEAAKIHKDLINKFNTYQSENPQTAKNRIQLDAIEAKRRIGELRASNDEGKKYLSQGGGFYTEDEVAKTLINPKGSITDLGNLTKYKTKGVLADGTGVFSFVPVKKAGVNVDIKAYDDIPIDKSKLPSDYLQQMNGAPIPAGSQRLYSVKLPSKQEIERNVAMNLSNYDVAEDALYRVPDDIKMSGNPEKIEEAKRAIIRQDVLAQAPPGGYDFRDDAMPTASQGTAAERKVPTEGAPLVIRTQATNTQTGKTFEKDLKYPMGWASTKTINAPNSNTYDLNTLIRAKDLPPTFQLSTSNVAIEPSVTRNGKTSPANLVVIGKAQEFSQKDLEKEKMALWRDRFIEAKGSELGSKLPLTSESAKPYEPSEDDVQQSLINSGKPVKERDVQVSYESVKDQYTPNERRVYEKALEDYRKKGKTFAQGSETKTYPLPEGKPARGKKNGVWYSWDESIGKYVKE